MGGDDLGGDDDYLFEPVVAGKDDDDDDDDVSSSSKDEVTAKKRALEDDDDDKKESIVNKRKKLSNEDVLIQAGCGIESSSVQDQLSFLTTSLKHYSMLQATTTTDKSSSLSSSDWNVTAKQLVTSSKDTLGERVRDVVSLKRLKKHRHVRSPAVIVVCQSARRAVAVLKELNTLRLRAIKLFPKNGDVQQQVTALRQTPFALAVGTPHRLVALASDNANGLSLELTQLVVLDTAVSKKQYTVCTLPDTAADTMAFLRVHVLPAMKTNKNLKIAFL